MQAPSTALDGRDPAAIDLAARRLAAGELVGFPTETVYGLGARADDDAAVARIFSAKGRPADHPLIVHVPDRASAEVFARELPPVALRLMDAFWPGPLTIIVPRAPGMGGAAAGGQDSIGLRCPSHPVAHALLVSAQRLGVAGVAAPSANRFGRVSPTLAAHVLSEFGDEVLVLDGGPCDLGIESAIVDCTRGFAVLLRPGVLAAADIEAAAGMALRAPDKQAPRASGTLESHYAPRARVRLMSTAELQLALANPHLAVTDPTQSPASSLAEDRRERMLAVYSRTAVATQNRGIVYRSMPADARVAAHELFAVLREFDEEGVSEIWVEAPPRDAAWDGVRDRLGRAAA